MRPAALKSKLGWRPCAAHQVSGVRMVPAGSGSMVSRWFPAQENGKSVVRAEGVEPTRAVKPCGFSCRLRLSPPGRCAWERSHQVSGLDYPFTLPRKIRSLGAARLVSIPSRRRLPSGLGLGLPFQVSPNLSSSASPISQASTQVFLKSAASAIPPRPRSWSSAATCHRAGRVNLHVSFRDRKSW